jgi:hypothetical protein
MSKHRWRKPKQLATVLIIVHCKASILENEPYSQRINCRIIRVGFRPMTFNCGIRADNGKKLLIKARATQNGD